MGFLLGGIGDINAKREQNFLIVTKGAWGGWVGGPRVFPPKVTPPPSPHPDTTVTQVEDAFKHFTSRPDIAIILITQSVRVWRAIGVVVVASALILTSPSPPQIAEDIRPLLDSHTAVTPAVLEIPSKDQPYDPAKDSILKRARGLFSAEDFK